MDNVSPKLQGILDTLREEAEITGGRVALPAYAWPGGYPMYYFAEGYDVLCPGCAEIARKDMELPQVIDYHINYEDPHLYCEECEGWIESAYSDETPPGRSWIETSDYYADPEAPKEGYYPEIDLGLINDVDIEFEED